MSATTEKKPRLTTSAMIASIASEGQRVKTAPFGKALVELAQSRPPAVAVDDHRDVMRNGLSGELTAQPALVQAVERTPT